VCILYRLITKLIAQMKANLQYESIKPYWFMTILCYIKYTLVMD
jgi:hypothetical protein